MSDVTAHIHVTGLVQGVGYRYFTSRRAGQLGLTGFVRNLPDGTVEVVASGDRGRISDLVDLLRVGPRGASVRGVELDWMDAADPYERFEIR